MAKPAPLPAAMLVSAGAQAETVLKTLATDLLVVKKRIPGKGKRGPKSTPTDIEFHLNPLGLGCLAVGAGLTMWLLQMRVGVEQVHKGYWEWPDGTKASKELPYDARGDAPTRFVDDGLKPDPADYRSDFWAYQAALIAWQKSCTQVASWVDLGLKPVYAAKERAGFTMEGLGTAVADSFIPSNMQGWKNIWKWAFPWGPLV